MNTRYTAYPCMIVGDVGSGDSGGDGEERRWRNLKRRTGMHLVLNSGHDGWFPDVIQCNRATLPLASPTATLQRA